MINTYSPHKEQNAIQIKLRKFINLKTTVAIQIVTNTNNFAHYAAPAWGLPLEGR